MTKVGEETDISCNSIWNNRRVTCGKQTSRCFD